MTTSAAKLPTASISGGVMSNDGQTVRSRALLPALTRHKSTFTYEHGSQVERLMLNCEAQVGNKRLERHLAKMPCCRNRLRDFAEILLPALGNADLFPSRQIPCYCVQYVMFFNRRKISRKSIDFCERLPSLVSTRSKPTHPLLVKAFLIDCASACTLRLFQDRAQ